MIDRLLDYFLYRTFYLFKYKLIHKKRNFFRLKECWQQSNFNSHKPWQDYEFLTVDLEMSSLDAKTGEILSIGWVVIKNGNIQLNTAEHHIIHSNQTVGQSATIHQLRDCEIEQGLSITDISGRFLTACHGRTLIFHHAHLDLAFLNKASHAIYGAPLLLGTVDTLLLEKKKRLREQGHIAQGELKLAACRERYNLPLYPAHNALMDAMATAELFIAIAKYKGGQTALSELI